MLLPPLVFEFLGMPIELTAASFSHAASSQSSGNLKGLFSLVQS